MTELGDASEPTPLRVVMRFVVTAEQGDDFESQMRELIDLLGTMPGYQAADLGRATDDPTLWSLVTTWRSVGEYRRAISSYEVKVRQPLLSRAIDEPSAFEVLYSRRGDAVVVARTARSAEGDGIDLGAG